MVEDERGNLSVPRLLLKGAGEDGPEGPVRWVLRYGGVRLARGRLDEGEEVSFADVPEIEPFMDSAGLSFIARYSDGEIAPIEAICVRPPARVTRAEEVARERWPLVRHQRAAPELRRPLLAMSREIRVPPDDDGKPRGRRTVYIYQHFSAVLARRRRTQETEARAERRRAALAQDQQGQEV